MRTACCQNCTYAGPLCVGRCHECPLGRFDVLICVNSADAPGALKEVLPGEVCRNFRAKREPPLRLTPPEPPDDACRYIALTKGKFALVGVEDYESLSRHKWTTQVAGNKFYAFRNCGGACLLMHRQLMNPPKGMIVDHIDGNGLNNRRENLRICTSAQNNRNRAPRGKSSRYKGVSFDKERKKWKASVWVNGESVLIGRYEDQIEAARVRDRVAYDLDGQYAYLNFPEEIHPGRCYAHCVLPEEPKPQEKPPKKKPVRARKRKETPSTAKPVKM